MTSVTTHLVGKKVRLPLVGRLIPIIADAYSDPEKGSGAVKITPAHDFNDFEVGKRHKLPQINVFDAEAPSRAASAIGDFYAGGLPADELEAVLADEDGVERVAARNDRRE